MELDEQPIESGPAPVVMLLLVTNAVVFLLLMAAPQFGIQNFALWPLVPVTGVELPAQLADGEFHVWQLVTHAFLHGGLLHLFINMFVLWMFGGPIEKAWGSKMFALYYGVCIIGAGLVQLIVSSSGLAEPMPALGASGGVFAVLLAFGLMYPNQIILLIFPPIPMKAKYFVIIIGVFELVAGTFGVQQGVANFAHLAGMLFGFLFIQLFRSRLRFPGG